MTEQDIDARIQDVGPRHLKIAAVVVGLITIAGGVLTGATSGALIAAFLGLLAAVLLLTILQVCIDSDRAAQRRMQRSTRPRPGRSRPF